MSLGTVHDIDEMTIINAYEKQVKDDPGNILFYLECLQDIGNSLPSRRINQYTESQASKGVFTRFDLGRACRTLEIDDPNKVTEEGLIAVFHSRCTDAPHREREFQLALKVIQHFWRGQIGATSNGGSIGKKRMIAWNSN